jgi:hypothetical protein
MPVSALAFVKFGHLIGLVLGFGCAALADYLILRQAILKPITRQLTDWLKYISHFAFAGLALLWVTGFILIYIRYLQDPIVLTNQKLWAKIVIVTLLSVNGAFVHHHALRLVSERVGRRLFDSHGKVELMGLTLIAAISSVSWITPVFLGVASELNYKVNIASVLGVYALLVLTAWLAMAFFVSKIAPHFTEVRAVTRMPQPPAYAQDDVHQKYVELLKRVRSM